MSTNGTWGLLAEFDNPAALLRAARRIRESGYTQFDCHSPFPVHGVIDAMGQRRSILAYLVAGASLFAMIGGLALQWWTNAVDYPLVISGKPFISYQAYAPVGFGITILTAALVAVGAMLKLNGLPRFVHPVFHSDRFRKVTDDGFFVSIEAADPQFDTARTQSLLQSIGATHVEVLQR